MIYSEMPPNPDVLQIRIGGLVSLVLVRDREAKEYKVVIAEHGLCAKRTEVPLPEDQARRAAEFLKVPLGPGGRHIVTDDLIRERVPYEPPVTPIDEDDEETDPSGSGVAGEPVVGGGGSIESP